MFKYNFLYRTMIGSESGKIGAGRIRIRDTVRNNNVALPVCKCKYPSSSYSRINLFFPFASGTEFDFLSRGRDFHPNINPGDIPAGQQTFSNSKRHTHTHTHQQD